MNDVGAAVEVDSPTSATRSSGELLSRTAARIHSLVGEELRTVDQDVAALVRDGLSAATDAAAHLHDAGGKRIRPVTVLLAARCFGSVRDAHEVAVAAELIHLATLLHDDVVDGGEERRGRPTSRRLFGNAVSVLAGDQLLTQALERTALAAPGRVLTELLVILRRLVDGEIVQVRHRFRLDTSEETYFRIARDKTASLFRWAARAGALSVGAPSSATDALGEFGERAGLAFQLVDDVLDYTGDPKATGKALLVDLAEGKLTLPLIRALVANPSLASLIRGVRNGDRVAALRAAQAIRATGVCEGVRDLACAETEAALEALAAVPPSPARELLADIATELTRRRS